MKKHFLYALLFAVIVFVSDGLKNLLIYFSFLNINFTDNSALDILYSTIIGFIVGLFFSWALDLPKQRK
ncbi:hypothetical protein BUZ53_10945 [Staphylococcus hominis]|nr:hypothetical protein BUZ53_10945 [Staphylococcus hominis]